jgi:hypothetical protein
MRETMDPANGAEAPNQKRIFQISGVNSHQDSLMKGEIALSLLRCDPEFGQFDITGYYRSQNELPDAFISLMNVTTSPAVSGVRSALHPPSESRKVRLSCSLKEPARLAKRQNGNIRIKCRIECRANTPDIEICCQIPDEFSNREITGSDSGDERQ